MSDPDQSKSNTPSGASTAPSNEEIMGIACEIAWMHYVEGNGPKELKDHLASLLRSFSFTGKPKTVRNLEDYLAKAIWRAIPPEYMPCDAEGWKLIPGALDSPGLRSLVRRETGLPFNDRPKECKLIVGALLPRGWELYSQSFDTVLTLMQSSATRPTQQIPNCVHGHSPHACLDCFMEETALARENRMEAARKDATRPRSRNASLRRARIVGKLAKELKALAPQMLNEAHYDHVRLKNPQYQVFRIADTHHEIKGWITSGRRDFIRLAQEITARLTGQTPLTIRTDWSHRKKPR